MHDEDSQSEAATETYNYVVSLFQPSKIRSSVSCQIFTPYFISMGAPYRLTTGDSSIEGNGAASIYNTVTTEIRFHFVSAYIHCRRVLRLASQVDVKLSAARGCIHSLWCFHSSHHLSVYLDICSIVLVTHLSTMLLAAALTS
jgi:hypothetical protein